MCCLISCQNYENVFSDTEDDFIFEDTSIVPIQRIDIFLQNNRISKAESYQNNVLKGTLTIKYSDDLIRINEQYIGSKDNSQIWKFYDDLNNLTRSVVYRFCYEPEVSNRLTINKTNYLYNSTGTLDHSVSYLFFVDSSGNVFHHILYYTLYEYENDNQVYSITFEKGLDTKIFLTLSSRNEFYSDLKEIVGLNILNEDPFILNSKNIVKSSRKSCWEGEPWDVEFFYNFDEKGRIIRRIEKIIMYGTERNLATDFRYIEMKSDN